MTFAGLTWFDRRRQREVPLGKRDLLWCILLLAMICCAACSPSNGGFKSEILASADLPGARASENSRLQQALREVELAGGLPRQLTRDLPPEMENAAVALAQVFDERSREELETATRELMPHDRFEFDEAQFKKVKRLLRRWQADREKLTQAAKHSRCAFSIKLERGYFAEHLFLSEVAIAVRLALLECVPNLADDEFAAAQRNLRRAFRWIAWLDSEPLLEAKLLAAQLRGEALLVVEAIAWHPRADAATWSELYLLLRQQLDHWPSEAAGIAGDRARAMHAYEMIRRGRLELLLTPAEIASLKEDSQLDSLRKLDHEAIDLDEAIYLETAAQIIALCDRPYFKRQPQLEEIYGKLESQRGNRGYPELAMRLFLPELGSAQQQLARARGRCEGWAVALASASGESSPPYRANPLNGHEYQVQRTDEELTVTLGDARSRDPGVPMRVK